MSIKIKISNKFAKTISQTDVSKEFVEQIIKGLFEAQEKHHLSADFHHHLYIQTFNKEPCKNLKEYFEEVYGKTVNISNIKSVRYWLKYITKEDRNVLFDGVSPDQLSFYFQAITGARSNQFYDVKHQFVARHPVLQISS